ncbi:hypothetical protein [Chamaesiphon minutus]|uniref:Uncharacterized protein n=1 Tax=Chamaesiphon minutus (strain ATCC 27169 / PCC 6605) TaxID=1173020 RepID=K9UI53_CHAP6|nr:hypothetical protein [Chamaesiphon minutus]AFY94313.1 hypothetical protein Cha6605_3309 [Chamaesiphon minutus PCC 6605]
MQLEAQLDKLAKLGLVINPEITIEDILFSFDRQALESDPFKLLLFAFGSEVEREPKGRRICNRVWNFDPECVAATGDYVKIVQQLCLLGGDADYLQEIVDYIDLDEGECWLEYTLGDTTQHWEIEPNDDWADMLALSYVMEDLQRDGRQFYSLDNEQAMILVYVDLDTAIKLSDLCDEDLEPVIPA